MQRLFTGALDPGGFHRDFTAPLAMGFELAPLRTKALLADAIGACDEQELAAVAEVALGARRLEFCSEILGEMARRELPRTEELRRELVALSVAERRYEQASEELDRLAASTDLGEHISAALMELDAVGDADDDRRAASAAARATSG